MGPSWVDLSLSEGVRALAQGLVTRASVPSCPAAPSCPSLTCSSCAACPACPAANCTCSCPASPSVGTNFEIVFVCAAIVLCLGAFLGCAAQWLLCSARCPTRRNDDFEEGREAVQARVRALRKLP
mmetsp:Transcript_106088/g.338730  ORF Transcript_106088/g.338730 Transcript_106088/m.338730 type:complete len:126 (-) Transcript_106088:194-571(-)